MAFLEAVSTTPTCAKPRAFFSPWLDFMFMGGGSLIALPILAILIPDSAIGQVGLAVLVLAVIINHPHFAHSYQIFYGAYGRIMRAPNIDPLFRRRYIWAGIAVPALLICYFALAIGWSEPDMLRYSVNAMMFITGWHYVKQGYGMLMVDAAMKRSFLSETAKKVLLGNSYICWAASWLVVNRAVAEHDFLGLSYYTFAVPDAAMTLSLMALAASSLLSALVLVQHARKHGAAFPITGAAAYIAALYMWLFMHYDPELGALIPAFHSVQYLYMVWRQRLNVEAQEQDAAQPIETRHGGLPLNRGHVRFINFILAGMALGFAAFWVMPAVLDRFVPYDHDLFGHGLFLIMVWVFINVHHFFIDNAMWRKENPHTLKHLFSHL